VSFWYVIEKNIIIENRKKKIEIDKTHDNLICVSIMCPELMFNYQMK
jgi:transcription initiation factor IIE alpha subunit